MMPSMPTSRERAAHRRALYLLLAGMAAAAACLLMEAPSLGPVRPEDPASQAGAPPEPAIRPNEPTEPVLGKRVSGPGG